MVFFAAISVLGWVADHPAILLVPIAIAAVVALYFAWDWHRERERRRAHQRALELHQADESVFLGRVMQLSPIEFESFCARLLEEMRGMVAQVTQRTNDAGVDIVLRDSDGSMGVAQCKMWINHPVDRPVVQKLYGEMSHRGAAFGILLATTRFTDGARRWADDKEIELIGLDELVLMTLPSRTSF